MLYGFKVSGEMTEREYIICSDLSVLNGVLTLLNKLDPEISTLIDVQEYVDIRFKLRDWQEKHFKELDTK